MLLCHFFPFVVAKQKLLDAKIHHAARVIQLLAVRSSLLLSRRMMRQKFAATRLQSAYRQHLSRKDLARVATINKQERELREVAEEHAACCISSAWRCRRSRKEKRELEQGKAARSLARQWQIHKSKMQLQQLQREQRASRENGHARDVQGAWRSHVARRTFAKAQEHRQLMHRAAETLQARFRSARARTRLVRRLEGTEAATRIQQNFRCHGRRRIASKMKAAMEMVWRFRMQQARRQLMSMYLDDLILHLADSLHVPQRSVCLHCLMTLAYSRGED